MSKTIYTVPAVVVRIHDADTLVCSLDMGWGTWRKDEPVRLEGVNAPELSTAEGQAAKAFVETLLKAGDEVTVISKKYDKWRRTLGRITLPDSRDLSAVFARNRARGCDEGLRSMAQDNRKTTTSKH